MNNLLPLLRVWSHDTVERHPVALQNLEAARSDAEHLAGAIDRRGEAAHRVFSMFTPPEGRA